MSFQPLDLIPLWLLLPLICALLGLAIESGYRLGRWRHAKMPDEREQPVGAMVASILALLALLLGFTFSLAAARFDARRQAVMEEANAIGTTHLRARLLAEPERTNIATLLREYVELRVQSGNDGEAAADIARSEELHLLLWAETQAAADSEQRAIFVSLFANSLNQMIDLHSKRVFVGLRSRIPLVIWVSLFSLAFLGMAAVGYQAGLSATRRSPAMIVLALVFTLVLLLIADLDRGQEGLMRVSQQALVDVQRTMQQITP